MNEHEKAHQSPRPAIIWLVPFYDPGFGSLLPRNSMTSSSHLSHHVAETWTLDTKLGIRLIVAVASIIKNMSLLPVEAAVSSGIPQTFQWPVKFCLFSTTVTYILSLITGNVSQVDRVWTFLPVIYSLYYAFLPFWPNNAPLPLLPTVPAELDRSLVNEGNPRTLLMVTLQVGTRLFIIYFP